MFILPMLTTELERNFSLSKRIKTDWRDRLAQSTVSDLMTVKLSEVNLEFKTTPAISVSVESSKCKGAFDWALPDSSSLFHDWKRRSIGSPSSETVLQLQLLQQGSSSSAAGRGWKRGVSRMLSSRIIQP